MPFSGRPNAFIVGAPKCATTSIANALQHHPAIFVPFIKEPAFFGSDLHSEVSTLRDYLALYASATATTEVAIDATTLYLFSRDAVRQIMTFEPCARIVCAFRDPLEMAPAYHSQLLRHHVDRVADFDAAWADQPARRARMAAGGAREPLYEEICLFGRQLERLFAVAPKDQVFVILFDDLVADPPAILADLQRFLGVRSIDLALPHENENREVAHERLHRFKMRVGKYGRGIKRRMGVHRNLGILNGLLGFSTRPARRAVPSLRTLAKMKQAFGQDMRLFEEITGRSLRGPLWDTGHESCETAGLRASVGRPQKTEVRQERQRRL